MAFPPGLITDDLYMTFDDVTLRTYAAGSYVAGDYVPGAATTATIRASVQVPTPEEVLDLPEAQRTREAKKFWTRSAVGTIVDGTNTPTAADEIDWNGETWEVLIRKHWQSGELDHYVAIAARRERE